jgi:4-cresol dehydrogenase (hydroxylating)
MTDTLDASSVQPDVNLSVLAPVMPPAQSSHAASSVGVNRLSAALGEWVRVLGTEHVLSDAATLDRLGRSTLPTSTRPAAVLRPSCTDEVRQVAAIATTHGVPIYPISRGKNWGYGDACAVTDGQVILDLSRMNRIVEVNAELAYAVIEPGVTQGQLADYLRENKTGLWLDVTGAGPDASIVGNTLERGFGHTPYGDHLAHSCGMEVVLADGTVFSTGFGAFEGAKSARVFPWGIGPWLDGLFTQSNLGIVTQLGVWLMPEPETCQAFAFQVPRDDDLEYVVDAIRWLRLHDVVRGTVHVANDLRVISARRRYPWELTGGATPLPDNVRSELRREAGIGAWNVMGGLWGTRRSVAAARRAIDRRLDGLAHVHFVGRRTLRWGQSAARWLRRTGYGRRLGEMLESASSVYDLLVGSPSREHLKGVFWRSRVAPDAENPDPSQSGVIWLSPVLPMTAHACREVLGLVEPIFAAHRFEPLITMTAVTSRALVCVMSVCYDREAERETASALECYHELFGALMKQGYVPYRVATTNMTKLGPYARTYWDVASRLKSALDPAHVLSPGRYEPGSA